MDVLGTGKMNVFEYKVVYDPKCPDNTTVE